MTHVPVKLCRFKSNRAHKYLEKAFYEMNQPLDPIPLWLEPFVVMFTENEIELKNRFQTLSTATLDHIIVNHCYNGFELVKKSSFEFLYERIDGSEALDNTESRPPLDSDSLDNTVSAPAHPTGLDTTVVAEDSQVAPIPFPPAIDKGYPAGADLSSDSQSTSIFEVSSGRVGPVRTAGKGPNQQSMHKGSPDAWGGGLNNLFGIKPEETLSENTPFYNRVFKDIEDSIEAARKILEANGYSVIPPAKALESDSAIFSAAVDFLDKKNYRVIHQDVYTRQLQEKYELGFNKALDYALSNIQISAKRTEELKRAQAKIHSHTESRSDDANRSGE